MGPDDISKYDERRLTQEQQPDLTDISKECQGVLSNIEKLIERHQILTSKSDSLRAKSGRVWTRLKWDPAELSGLRDRIVSNVALLYAFHGRRNR